MSTTLIVQIINFLIGFSGTLLYLYGKKESIIFFTMIFFPIISGLSRFYSLEFGYFNVGLRFWSLLYMFILILRNPRMFKYIFLNNILKLLFIYITLIIISIIFSKHFINSINSLITVLFSYCFTVFIYIYLVETGKLLFLSKIFLIAFILPITLGWLQVYISYIVGNVLIASKIFPYILLNSTTYQIVNGPEYLQQISYVGYRVSAFFDHPNIFSHLLVINLFFHLVNIKLKIINIYFSYLIIVSSFLLITIISAKTSIIMFFIGLLILLKFRQINIKFLILTFISILFFISISNLFLDTIISRFNSFDDSKTYRVELWTKMINRTDLFLNYLTFGVGLDNYSYYSEGSTTNQKDINKRGVMAHNDILRILVEHGLFALVIFMMLIVYALSLLYEFAKKEKHIIPYYLSIIVFLIGSFVENLNVPSYQIFIYIVFGVVAYLVNKKHNSRLSCVDAKFLIK